jgi:HK97 gp10 family phage protein
MKLTLKVEGLRELDQALGELSRATARNVLRRVGKKALTPVAIEARQLAPVDEGDLRDSIGVGTKLTRRQARLHRRAVRSGEASANFAEVFVGAGGLPQATLREFGGDDHPPHPYMRPAWDSRKTAVLSMIKADLGIEIAKAARRAAARSARVARRT